MGKMGHVEFVMETVWQIYKSHRLYKHILFVEDTHRD